jgi:malate synthase
MKKMAVVVDRQNQGDSHYRRITNGYEGAAFQGALDLVFKGREEANGYTEPVLHVRRREAKMKR